ncbi:HU domain-containing protein [Aquimarina rhabdastrellae]
MKTAHYISELLYRYECVIIPEFGAFLTQRQSAKINEVTHTFQPPKKLISFNRQLQQNDGLLANYIASSENISYNEAVAQIRHFVEDLNTRLNKGQNVVLSKIGIFSQAEENTLHFEPSDRYNYLTEAFGLDSFVSPAVKREEVIVEDTVDTKPPIVLTSEHEETTSNNRSYIKYAAAAVAITIGISGLWSVKQYQDQQQEFATSLELQEAQQKQIQEATFDILSPLPAVTLNLELAEEDSEEFTVGNLNYHIVAGAYRIERNANKKIEKLKALGYNARIIGVNKYGLHQVIYNSYATRRKAEQALAELKDGTDQRAWILIQKL